MRSLFLMRQIQKTEKNQVATYSIKNCARNILKILHYDTKNRFESQIETENGDGENESKNIRKAIQPTIVRVLSNGSSFITGG